MAKFHISPDGVARRCSAGSGENSRGCKYGYSDAEHYATKEAALAGAEEKLSQEYDGSFKKNGVSVGDSVSADVSMKYAFASIMLGHLHNSNDVGGGLETFYYSSPQGRLELQRRAGGSFDDRNNEYRKIFDRVVENDGEDNKGYVNFTEENWNAINDFISSGERKVLQDYGSNDYVIANRVMSDFNPDDEFNDIRYFCVDNSKNWLGSLSTQQQEDISNLTSNGFTKIQKHLGFVATGELSAYSRFNKRNSVDDVKESLRLYDSVLRSFGKVPKLDKPALIYRGTTMDELSDLSGGRVEELLSGGLDGELINSDSRLLKMPQSATALPGDSRRFGDDIVLEVASKSFASPVNVSAWGSAEGEVYINPTKNYRIKESRVVASDPNHANDVNIFNNKRPEKIRETVIVTLVEEDK